MKHIATTTLAVLFTFGLAAQCFNTEEEFKSYFKKNEGKLDPIEGTWIENADSAVQHFLDSLKVEMKLFIIKSKNQFIICRLPLNNNTTTQVNNEKFTRKKKEGHYLYSKYTYYKSKGQQRQNGSSVTGEAMFTDSLHLSIKVGKWRASSSVPNSTNPSTFSEKVTIYTKLNPLE